MYCKNCKFKSRQRSYHKCINSRSKHYNKVINDDSKCDLANIGTKTLSDLLSPALINDLGKLLVFVDVNNNVHEVAEIDYDHDDILVLKEKI